MMLIEPVGDFSRGGEPNARMRQYVFHRTTERAYPMRLADPVGVEGNTHDAPLFGAFRIHRVEVIADLAGEVIRLLATAVQDYVVDVHRVGHRDQPTGLDVQWEWLVVVIQVGR